MYEDLGLANLISERFRTRFSGCTVNELRLQSCRYQGDAVKAGQSGFYELIVYHIFYMEGETRGKRTGKGKVKKKQKEEEKRRKTPGED